MYLLSSNLDSRSLWILLFACGIHTSGPLRAQSTVTDLRFTEVTEASGIHWEHTTGRSKRGYIIEGVGSGMASFDYDRDGRIDLFLLSGKALKGESRSNEQAGFFRNHGSFQFVDVSRLTGVDGSGYGLGVCAADYDGDGFADLFINNFGLNRLYMNCGDGTFCESTQSARVDTEEMVGAGVAFADFNGDELLDLYVGNYVDFTLENSVYIERNGQVYHSGPRYYRSDPDTLFQSVGDGSFENITEQSGIGKYAGPTMGLIAADLNQDGKIDIFTCNDAKPNFFFVNDGKSNFAEDGILSGLAFDFRGTANASMGVDLGDFDGDGLQDLIVTNYQNELPVLYRNLGEGQFEDVSTTVRIAEGLQPHVTWGCTLTDFDNNGTLDLYIGCGHFDDAEIIDDRTAKKVRDFVMLNDKGRFKDVSQAVGLTAVESTRAVAFEDFDNDGDVDVVTLNSNAKPTVLRNDLPNNRRWLQLELSAKSANRFAIGSKVVVTYGEHHRHIQVVCGRGYQSSYGDRIYVGLPHADLDFAQVRVEWPNRTVEDFQVPVAMLSQIVQGAGELLSGPK